MTGGRRVVVIGAGVAGLAAAVTLRDAGVDVTVIERESVVGGRVRTLEVDGERIDLGAQFIATFCRETVALAGRFGLADAISLESRHAAVVFDGRAHPIDSVSRLLGPGLLPVSSRLRLPLLAIPVGASWWRLDPHDLARAAPLDDGDAAHFVRRWCGAAVDERFVEPVVRGLLYWDLPTTSRAVLLVMLRVALGSRTVYKIDGGLGALPAALASGFEVHTSVAASRIVERADDGWVVECATGPSLPADGIVCATTASVASALCPRTASANALASVAYSTTICVVYRMAGPDRARGDATHVFAPPASEILASVNPSSKDSPIMRVFLSDSGVARLGHLDDRALAGAVLAAVAAAGGETSWTAGASMAAVHRWSEALPRFDVGALRSPVVGDPASIDIGTLAFAGDYIGGPFVEGAVVSGRQAAARVLARLRA